MAPHHSKGCSFGWCSTISRPERNCCTTQHRLEDEECSHGSEEPRPLRGMCKRAGCIDPLLSRPHQTTRRCLASNITRGVDLRLQWAFGVVGSVEGAFAIATGTLRSLSEQQLLDCDTVQLGCSGGNPNLAFKYVVSNGGLDSEADYKYYAEVDQCWTEAQGRHAASIDSFAQVPPNSDAQLMAAVAKVPVAVAVEATSPSFQHYRTGVYDGPCGADTDHEMLAVGYTTDAFILKNSWGAGWGSSVGPSREGGFMQIKRDKTSKNGTCGLYTSAAYAIKHQGAAPPLPPPTPPGTIPPLPCNCTHSCRQMCGQMGYTCCGGPSGCPCSPGGACPTCALTPKNEAYESCKHTGPTPDCPVSPCGNSTRNGNFLD